jgi:curli production assembly/transport component CsgG
MSLKAIFIIRSGIGLILIAFNFILGGCISSFKHPIKPEPARLGEFSQVYKKELSRLPSPKEKVYAAVYNFRDQTGQYKLSETVSNWSTAVTQGATSVLLQSLEESGWFITIEREGLSNLLNERRIIRQTQEQYKGNSSSLSPLLYAGIIIEGGIIAYESNIRTGGIGARYFGTGASGEYREDQVTIYLRAVSTSSGKILKTVHSSKTLLSQKLDMGVFRYVSLKRLLEAETGYTYNEPSFVAVQAAIDKAVLALIVEGLQDNLWTLNDPEDVDSEVISEYFKEKEQASKTDYLGNMTLENRKAFSVGAAFSPSLYDGDLNAGKMQPHGSFEIGVLRNKTFQLILNAGAGMAAGKSEFEKYVASSSILLHYDVFKNLSSTPFLRIGYGLLHHDNESLFANKPVWNENLFQFLNLGVGYQWKVKDKPLYLKMGIDSQVFLNDGFDDFSYGNYYDRLWYFTLGVEYRLNLFK